MAESNYVVQQGGAHRGQRKVPRDGRWPWWILHRGKPCRSHGRGRVEVRRHER